MQEPYSFNNSINFDMNISVVSHLRRKIVEGIKKKYDGIVLGKRNNKQYKKIMKKEMVHARIKTLPA